MENIYSNLLFYLVNIFNKLFKKKESQIIYKDIQNILLINPQGIGDYFVSTPLISALRDKFEYAKIVLLTSEKCFEVAKNDSNINKIIIYSDAKYFEAIKKLQNEKFDLIIDLQITLMSIKRTLISYLVGANYRLCFQRKKFRNFLPTHEVSWLGKHMVENYLEIAKYLECNISNKKIIVNTNYPVNNQIFNDFKKNSIYVALHISTTNQLHRWKTQSWLDLINKLSKKYKNVQIILTGENDEQTQELTKDIKNNDVVNLIGKLNISELIKVIEKLDLLITIDTSTVHIAAGLDIPTIALYGPTILDFWFPWNKSKQIALQGSLTCKGRCREYDLDSLLISREKCTEYSNTCLTKILPDEVISKIDYLLNKKK